ncbi:hypothetical protein ABW19_dt0206777 [Dactylella cylindrospora]|nr:hypothetical protein ABW19_dt0206777 [Dactylella cylindrospora]
MGSRDVYEFVDSEEDEPQRGPSKKTRSSASSAKSGKGTVDMASAKGAQPTEEPPQEDVMAEESPLAEEDDGDTNMEMEQHGEEDDEYNESPGDDEQESEEEDDAEDEPMVEVPMVNKGDRSRRRNQVENYGDDDDDDTDTDEEHLRSATTLDEFSTKFSNRAIVITQGLKTMLGDLEPERSSIERRMRSMEGIILDQVDELDTKGLYTEVFKNHRLNRQRYARFPSVLPGDPYQDPNSIEFNENDPRVQALFKTDEEAAYAIDIYEDDLKHIAASIKAADEMLRAATRFFAMAKGYQTSLVNQQRFLNRLIDHEETVKQEYLEHRIEVRDRVMSEKREIMSRKRREIRAANAHKERYLAWQASVKARVPQPVLNRKRGQDLFDADLQKRQKQSYGEDTTRARAALPRRVQIDTAESEDDEDDYDELIVVDEEDEYEDEHPPDVGRRPEPPVTPPPVERVRIESFGDHTPGRTRRYQHQSDDNETPLETVSNGILVDTEWKDDEIVALGEGMKRFQRKDSILSIDLRNKNPY